jgi:hypothetical protein
MNRWITHILHNFDAEHLHETIRVLAIEIATMKPTARLRTEAVADLLINVDEDTHCNTVLPQTGISSWKAYHWI